MTDGSDPKVDSDDPVDFTDLAKVPKKKGPGKGGASLQVHRARKSRMSALAPIPEGASVDPVKWAGDHLQTLAPDAAKELEYAMKFGSDTMRYVASKDILAINGHTTRPKETGAIPVSMSFNFGGPVGPTGAPILPFSNAARKLQSSNAPVAPAPSGVTIDAPTVKPKDRT